MAMAKILTLWNDEGRNEGDTRILRAPSEDLVLPVDQKSRAVIECLIETFLSRNWYCATERLKAVSVSAGVLSPAKGLCGRRMIP